MPHPHTKFWHLWKNFRSVRKIKTRCLQGGFRAKMYEFSRRPPSKWLKCTVFHSRLKIRKKSNSDKPQCKINVLWIFFKKMFEIIVQPLCYYYTIFRILVPTVHLLGWIAQNQVVMVFQIFFCGVRNSLELLMLGSKKFGKIFNVDMQEEERYAFLKFKVNMR